MKVTILIGLRNAYDIYVSLLVCWIKYELVTPWDATAKGEETTPRESMIDPPLQNLGYTRAIIISIDPAEVANE